MTFNPLKNKRTRRMLFNIAIWIQVILLVLGFVLIFKGLKSGTHFLDETGAISYFTIINISLDLILYIVGFVLFVSLGFEKLKKRMPYYIFMILIGSLMLVLITDLISWYSNGISELWVMTFISELLYYLFTYVAVTFLTLYIITSLDIKGLRNKKGFTALGIFLGLSEAFVIITSFTGSLFKIDSNGFYVVDVNVSFWLLLPMTFLYLSLLVLVLISKARLKTKLVLLSVVLGPIVSYILEGFLPYLQLAYGVMMISILIITSTIHLSESVELEAKEAELNNQKLTQMMNQIQPHFIYNVLSSIYYLCDKDSQRAKSAINDFSKYLRINIDSIKKNPIVSFKDELEFCKIYLSLEKMRFDDELRIVYDVETTDFNLPSFSVQPLVENAVKHGVSQKEGGGTVTIMVREFENEYVIRVIDDGVGFDDSQMFGNERVHVGIQNVKYRIESLCGGKLAIKSKIGEGTTSEVVIPKKED